MRTSVEDDQRYIKMKGRKIYEYALKYVPEAMMECLNKAGVSDIREVKKIFIHQANEKMDEAIIKRLFKLYGASEYDPMVAPMNIHDLGNSSVTAQGSKKIVSFFNFNKKLLCDFLLKLKKETKISYRGQ